MGLLAFSWFLLVFVVVIILMSGWGTRSDLLRKRKKLIDGRNNKQDSIEELNDTFFNRFFAPIIKQVKAFLEKMNSTDNKNGKKNDNLKQIETKLRLAGMDISAELFSFYKSTFLMGMIILTLFIAYILYSQHADSFTILVVVAVGFVIALIVPNIMLDSMGRSRQNGIRDQLPDALDLLGVCIEAGLSFDNSLLKVSEKLEGPFIEELLNVYREIQMGVPRNDALKKLSDGSDIPELKTFISALIQANQLGIPINNVMGVQSVQLRETRKQNAKEKGAKAPIIMLVPMIIFIFPVLFIMLMAPTVLNIMDMFG